MRLQLPIFTLILALPALAQDDSDALRDVVDKQGEQIKKLTSEVQKLKAGEGKTAREKEVEDYLDDTEEEYRRMPTVFDAKRSGWGDRVRLGGYMSLEYRDEEGKSSEFDFHRLVLKRVRLFTADNQVHVDSTEHVIHQHE